MAYDANNPFNKIINKELPAKIVLEDDNFMAFHDIKPENKIHILVIPKGQYTDFSDFIKNSPNTENFFKFIQQVIDKLQLEDYRLVMNTGPGADQTVFHFHAHILS